jgi:hypothetical protein
MYSCVVALTLASMNAGTEKFPDYNDAKVERQLYTLGRSVHGFIGDGERSLRGRAWDLLIAAQDENNTTDEALLFWNELAKLLDAWDKKHGRLDNSFDAGRMPHPFPVINYIRW